jgi:hypothetical protein
MVFLLIWVYIGDIAGPIIIFVINSVPYFKDDDFRELPIVIFLEGVLKIIMSKADKMLLILVILFIPLFQIYLIYCIVRTYLPPVIFFIPIRKMLLESVIIVELIESKIFPLMDTIGDILLKTVPFFDKLYMIFTNIGDFTKIYINDLIQQSEKFMTEFSKGSSVKEIMNGGNSDSSSYNEDAYKESIKYNFNENYSAADNQILEKSLKECVDAGFQKIKSDTEPLDKLKIMLANNGTSLGCNLKLFQKIESMKQSASSTTTTPPK